MRVTFLTLALLLGSASAPAFADEIKTRVPQANFDAFIQACRIPGVPAATCECMAFKMIRSGQEGEMSLDIIGLQSRKIADKAAEQKELIALLDRYHATLTQAKAAMAKFGTTTHELALACN